MGSSAEKTYLGFSRVVPGSTPSPVVSSALIALVAIGAGLRLMQYIGNPALSLDEIAVARNVLERNLWDLLATPLAYDQTAPKGFLIATKFVTSVFGSSDYALRLFPLLCSLAALDRKSTRLNSSHGYISYAVFCLKKKITSPNNT